MQKSLRGDSFIDRLLHERFYMSHVYEEYAVAMLVQKGFSCRLDRRKARSDIITDGGIRIEVKSSLGKKLLKNGAYSYDYFMFAKTKQELEEKCGQCDFFLLMGNGGNAIIPSGDILRRGRRRLDVNLTKVTNYNSCCEKASVFFNRYKDAWDLLK